MTDRILSEINEMKVKDLISPSVEVNYDSADLSLPEPVFIAKRISEYLMAQPVYEKENNLFTGLIRLSKAKVPADIFHREFHESFGKALTTLYAPNGNNLNRYLENLAVFEWQHASPNYLFIIENGITAQIEKVKSLKEKYKSEKEKFDYLCGQEIFLNGVIAYVDKCAAHYLTLAESCTDSARKQELLRIYDTLKRVPLNKCESFFDAIQCILFCFNFLPDSVGTIDRYLYPYYKKDTESGKLTREQAKEMLQELFVHLCNHTPVHDANSDRSAECHFAIGGYTEKGEDGFNEVSRLIIEALTEMDTRRPEISLRWTEKTDFEVLKYCLDKERKDKNKRIAFVNDEPRIKSLMNNCNLPYSQAVKYTMVGCNEPSFPGMLWLGGTTANIARTITDILYEQKDKVKNAKTFDEFYNIFEKQLEKNIHRIVYYMNMFDDVRAKDCNVVSAFLLDGCIENATPPNRGGCTYKIGGADLMGFICTIDSLSIIKQFVFDEKKISLDRLIEVLESNWEKDPDLRIDILKHGKFFGNSYPLSDEIAKRFTTSLYNITKDLTLNNGAKIIYGTLIGYNPHNTAFGKLTPATPDGRYFGDMFMIGTGQNAGKDREGLVALLNSVAKHDPKNIMTGPVVTNLMLNKTILDNDEYFDKYCKIIETYFKQGGLHMQPNYLSKEDLSDAKLSPEKYPNLKVRVSGYSATFVTLNGKLQDEIICRTVK